jgi:crossover junction endodeoxyribonuclease RusA
MNVLLPFPPGLNNLFSNVPRVGRVPTKRYKAWQEEAGWFIKQHPDLRPVAGDVEVLMFFGRPDKRKRDLDGLMKAPLDLLVKHGLIEDDSRVQRLTVAWSEQTKNACLVIVEPHDVETVAWWPPEKPFPENYRATGSQSHWTGLIAKEKA